MSHVLELIGVDKTYQSGKLTVPTLHDIDVAIESGEMIAIMGPSGSGKSTLMHILGLLDRPTKGQVKIAGEPIALTMSDAKLAQLRGQKIGFVFQAFNLLPRLTALENVLVPTTYQKGSKTVFRRRATDLLKQVGLEERLHHKPTELSGGEKQRVAIARALINEPDIILADEPTGNLDSKSGQEVMETLKKLNKDGKTVVIITHDPKVAAVCDRTIRLLDGRIEGGKRA